MSSLEMASINKISYQRLIRDDDEFEEIEIEERGIERKRSWTRFRRVGSNKKRFKLRIPGLRRLLRRKAKLFSAVRVSWSKVLKRLKESKSHMGDLFAGNYLLMQVSPSSLKSFHNKYSFTNHGIHGLSSKYSFTNHGIHGLPSKYSLERKIA
ncbi:hypothetical protein BVC80_1837g467 [Macleaya cordata]|uniref:Uncharacterized protein n=1 Tax=Macleaya cordata TaxID=56857 RepID=A0A200R4J0_MACCD|nr:hypothetical protein BVC80_1837g467 [Macleaya cordata]